MVRRNIYNQSLQFRPEWYSRKRIIYHAPGMPVLPKQKKEDNNYITLSHRDRLFIASTLMSISGSSTSLYPVKERKDLSLYLSFSVSLQTCLVRHGQPSNRYGGGKHTLRPEKWSLPCVCEVSYLFGTCGSETSDVGEVILEKQEWVRRLALLAASNRNTICLTRVEQAKRQKTLDPLTPSRKTNEGTPSWPDFHSRQVGSWRARDAKEKKIGSEKTAILALL